MVMLSFLLPGDVVVQGVSSDAFLENDVRICERESGQGRQHTLDGVGLG